MTLRISTPATARQKIVVPRETIPQPVRHAQDPLSDRHIGKHPVDEMRGALGHSAAAAARAERTPFARESDEPVESTAGAMKAREAARQPAAPGEIAERLLDESRQALTLAQRGGLGSEGFEVVADDAVQDGVAGRSALVDRQRRGHAATGARTVPVCGASCPAQSPDRQMRVAKTAKDSEPKECSSCNGGLAATRRAKGERPQSGPALGARAACATGVAPTSFPTPAADTNSARRCSFNGPIAAAFSFFGGQRQGLGHGPPSGPRCRRWRWPREAPTNV